MLPFVSCETRMIAATALFAFFVAAVIAWAFFRPSGSAAAKPARVAVVASIGTSNPPDSGDAATFLKVVDTMGYPPELRVKVDRIVAGSGIERRHSAVGTDPTKFMPTLEAADGLGRARVWEEWAPRMAVAAARDALGRWRHGSAADVTHVVTHSCTGFSAPGIDFAIVQQLGLASSTRRIGVNFAGCFGAFCALYTAKQIVEADTTGTAVVLIACAEVCTAHMTRDPRLELIVGNTIFADGGGAAIVTHSGFTGKGKRKGQQRGSRGAAPSAAGALAAASAGAAAPGSEPAATAAAGSASAADVSNDSSDSDAFEWALGPMRSEILPDSAGAMTWRQGVQPGQYAMWLDRSIPSALSGFFTKRGLGLVRGVGITNPWSCAWAIHPGGRAIIAAFETAFAALRIKGDGLEASAEVLRRYGNMSSPTILFVLQRVLASTAASDVFTAGFGPGLTVECARLFRVRRGQAPAATGASAAPLSAEAADVDADAAAEESGAGAGAGAMPEQRASPEAAVASS